MGYYYNRSRGKAIGEDQLCTDTSIMEEIPDFRNEKSDSLISR